ncbi:MAG TPA: cytochrome b/b6 domain-containing protein [Burkholderiaceae bacterium]|jgi:cytochrome b|nr:cytochrome b/b6 domain-containing protein [Burkholderiaceae bacterium]
MSETNAPTPVGERVVRVWDLPTRLFHWALVVALIAQVITGKIGGAAMTWHFRIGYCIFALIVFRLVWGFVGGHWSRFASFIYGPARVLRYLRNRHAAGDLFHVGHNPLGSASVFAMLAILIVQVATGLIGDDEIANVGPLNRFVSTATGVAATAWHKGAGFGIILVLVVLHVLAIVFYRVRKKQDLIGPMFSGDKRLPGAVPASADDRMSRVRALAIVLASAGLVAAVIKLGG